VIGGWGDGWGDFAWGGYVVSLPLTGGGVVYDVGVADTIAVTDPGASYDTPLRVSDAVAPSGITVRVDFSQDLDTSYAPLLDPSNYTIPGLTVTNVTVFSPFQVLLDTTPPQSAILYTVTVGTALSINGDSLGPDDSADFDGFVLVPTFIAGAESWDKVEVVFSTAMQVDSALTSPSSYSLKSTDGLATIPISSVALSGPTPCHRVTLTLGSPLRSKEFYALVVSPSVVSVLGITVVPNTYILQWADMTVARGIAPIEIPIKDFSGEVRGGILGSPDGQVFFSPALETAPDQSTIELERVSVCTRAYDVYEFPNPPDPQPLYTFGPGTPASLLGSGSVMWAPAERLGQAHQNLFDRHAEALLPTVDSPAYAKLVETIDITRASFNNDARWKTFPGNGAIVFKTAGNLTFIGPGPTTEITVDGPSLQVGDVVSFEDSVDTVRVGHIPTKRAGWGTGWGSLTWGSRKS
jgi:hypothetical protein